MTLSVVFITQNQPYTTFPPPPKMNLNKKIYVRFYWWGSLTKSELFIRLNLSPIINHLLTSHSCNFLLLRRIFSTFFIIKKPEW